MKTKLVIDAYGCVFRHNEYGDEPELIGTIEGVEHGTRWFMMYGDNRVLSVEELRQILDFL